MNPLCIYLRTFSRHSLKARFHYERGKEHSLFLLLIFPRLKLKRALSKAKKSIKKTKNNLFHARSENGFEGPFPLRAWKRAFFVSFIDLRLKRAVKIEASAKKKQ